MSAVTLATLESQVRIAADILSNSFITQAEIYAYVNEGVQSLHNFLVEALQDEYVFSSYSTSTVAGATEYDLPSDFYKLYTVDLIEGGTYRTLLPFQAAERNRLREARGSVPRYRVLGTKLQLLPEPPSGATLTITYAPEAVALALSGDSVRFPSGWHRFVVFYAARRALLRQEKDVSALDKLLSEVQSEIAVQRETRDMAAPQSAVDVENIVDFDYLQGLP